MPCEAVESDTEIPYGLRISLNKDSLKNLGLTVSDFEIGVQAAITCQCEVTELRSSKSDTYSSETVELSIVAMAVAKKA
jgi:hypothetical protein